ncbi:hypothetical protein CPB86DRAFT_360400 [Serendipita vermifera]|nr:hypothetical protein CPB86DRAFT_360400 [Serendipita vermifera]
MTEQREPAVHRIPLEIWWKILGEAIDQHNPLFYSTTFEGDAWSEYSSSNFFALEDYLQMHAETQRKIIGSVCRSWQAFARSRRDRCFTIKRDGTGDVLQQLEESSNARRGELHNDVCRMIINSQHCVKGFNWEIVEMKGDRVEVFILIPFPRLRRLRMNPLGTFDPNKFLKTLITVFRWTRINLQSPSLTFKFSGAISGAPLNFPSDISCFHLFDTYPSISMLGPIILA